ncbi:tyrosine-type recombinase/integrase [Winogradskyella pulchriflava]|uniref:Tyrosine-type recombinase/integrase n=2 Tax=Winogradskyella pulchriflava TaxID=1110688 RepID=A0ABV6QC94_9FLAO
MNGKLKYKIRIKKDYTRDDGTNALYLDITYNGDRKKTNLDIAVPIKYFDEKNQRVKKGFQHADAYNLLIEKTLADLNTIEINYKLFNETITISKVLEDLYSPSLRINYNAFAQNYLNNELAEGFIQKSTYRQQNGFIEKMKRFKDPILFSEIDANFIKKLKGHLKKIGNKKPTIEGTLKNFKKFLRAANDKNISTKIKYTQIKVGSMKGDFTFLLPEEVKALYDFYNSPFINSTWKNILQRYLFSCFTGLRIGDIEIISEENFIDEYLVWQSNKGGKFNKIKINATAKSLINFPHIFNGQYTREHINRELKLIAKACGIKKRLYYHSSRHTFGTNYLIAGGSLVNLKKALGHSKIETTMVYAHAVESIMNTEIELMDGIIS